MVKERHLPLPDSINPRHSLKSRERYIWWIVPLWMLSSSSWASVFYGFNVYILPITMNMFGDNVNYTLRTGQILYAFSISTFTAILPMYHIAKYMTDVGAVRVYAVGVVLYVLALVFAGLSNRYRSVWGFWLSIGILSGFATGFTNLPAAVGIVKWYREVGRPGLGSGIAGFCFGKLVFNRVCV